MPPTTAAAWTSAPLQPTLHVLLLQYITAIERTRLNST